MQVLITGASGFVGHHVTEHFLRNTDWTIVTLDRLRKTAVTGYDRLRDVNAYNDERIRRFTHDLNQPIGKGLMKEIGDIDVIFHIAADSHVDTSISQPVQFVKNNIVSTLELLEFARECDSLKRFVYFSTDEVYGSAPEGTDYVEGDRHNPGNPYAASKSGAEAIVRAYANTFKVPAIVTNGMNFIGERQAPEKFLPLILNKCRRGERVFIHGTPDKTEAGKRHYLHARNAGAALAFIVNNTTETLDPYDASKGVFHIVGEKEYDNLTFANYVAECAGLTLDAEIVDFHSARPGHDLRYAMSGRKLELLGFSMPVTIEESIRKVVEWSLREENLKWLDS